MEPKTTIEIDYDERTRVLQAKTIYTDEEKNLKSEIKNTYTGDKSVKRFLSHQKEKKLNAKKTIESANKMVTDLKDKEANLKKGLKPLTTEQEQLIEELRIIGTYQEYDKTKQQRVGQEKHLSQMTEGFKEDKQTYEKIKLACKSVDFNFD